MIGDLRMVKTPCFDCDGMMKRVFWNYPVGHFIVPNVAVFLCDSCGAKVLGDEGNNRIDSYMDSHRLTRGETL